MKADRFLTDLGLAPVSAVAPSEERFPDGAHYRIEIPSVENPTILRHVLAEAKERGVVVNRVSQGSGSMLITEKELDEMALMASDNGIEISLFVGPREGWDIGVQSRAADGPALAGQLRGTRQLRYGVEDVLRATEHGIRGFLIADLGLLEVLVGMQKAGDLPASTVWKISAMLAPSNPIAMRQMERMGASTVNVPSDLTPELIAELRAVSSLPIDVYVEAPDAMGGVVRGHESAELIAIAAPMYTKFGLRNSTPIYPAGMHNLDYASLLGREKVRRASLALEWIKRSEIELIQSPAGALGLGVPELG
ncbi:hypothetical protein GCM10027022_15250 [Alpinimonas psychrophila]|uniref:Peptidase family U32 n=1 Tax=Alpinimonas psychrophila TaxID=748908 RepID=A0A7W3JV07_9MICO|nr:hypothetical protein [Alpinimonas psychrophila]MBA8829627.1 hypothetical protein [Alpinimonas psychrophila]